MGMQTTYQGGLLMKAPLKTCMVLITFVLVPGLIRAQPITDQVDALDKQAELASYQKSIALLTSAIAADPNNYELYWRLARAHQNYGDLAASRKTANYKDLCVEHGRAGMKAGEKAIALKPSGVEGYFYAGCAAGTLSTGAGIYTILKDKLTERIRSNLERAYQIDKRFADGGPMQALASYYKDVPRLLGGNLSQAEAYARESMKYFPNDPAGRTILAEVLIKTDKKKNRAEILSLLQGVAGTPRNSPQYLEVWVTKAKELLAEM